MAAACRHSIGKQSSSSLKKAMMNYPRRFDVFWNYDWVAHRQQRRRSMHCLLELVLMIVSAAPSVITVQQPVDGPAKAFRPRTSSAPLLLISMPRSVQSLPGIISTSDPCIRDHLL